MNKRFKEFVSVTKSFFVVRFIVSFVIAFIYILIAAAIQGIFVDWLGETTFNYIVGGLLSLFLGILFCQYIGSLCFMFVKGWHVASLPYIDDIREKDLSAFDVGLTAFRKNLISFGVVYTVRSLLTGVINSAYKKMDKLLEGLPFAGLFVNVSKNGIVQYISKDLLHYLFDATVYYIVRHPSKSMGDVPGTALMAVKKYLCCFPGMMLSSVTAYILFRFIPKLLKIVLVVVVFITQGFIAGILISVLMYPVFYILDNALFDPLTMLMFLSVFSEKCDAAEEEDAIVAIVNGILSDADIDSDSNNTPEKDKVNEKATPVVDTDESKVEAEELIDVEPVLDDNLGQMVTSFPTPRTDSAQGLSDSQLQSLVSLTSTMETSLGDLEMDGDGEELVAEENVIQEISEGSEQPTGAGLGALLHRSAEGLDDDPLAGFYEEE